MTNQEMFDPRDEALIQKVTPADLLDMLAMAEALENKRKFSKMYHSDVCTNPYPKQKAFMNNVSKVKAMLGGNRCLGGETLIECALTGAKRRVDEIRGDHWVWAWNGEKRVMAKAKAPFKKEPQAIYRIELENGEWFTCSANHLILTNHGWLPAGHVFGFSVVGGLPESAPVLPLTNLGTCPPTHAVDAHHLNRKAVNSRSDYHSCRHSNGEQPHVNLTGVLDGLPSQACVPEHSHTRCDVDCHDDAPYKPLGFLPQSKPCGNHAYRIESLPSIPGGPDLSVVHVSDSESRSVYMLWIPTLDLLEVDPLSIDGSSPQSQPSCEEHLSANRNPSRFSIANSACSITSHARVARADYLHTDFVWDFEVPELGNYFCAGIVHHNTGKSSTASFVLACHLTGWYPDWWEGIRFDRGVDIWWAGETTNRVRDTLQQFLFGKIGELGTGMVPKDCIIGEPIRKPGIPGAYEIVRVRHSSGDVSAIQFFSYDMGREKFQGSSIDIMAWDEEPPAEVVKEGNMRVADRNGYVMYTFTPLNGMTPLLVDLLENRRKDVYTLTWDDVAHLDPEAKLEQIKGLAPHEIRARVYGEPTFAAGMVYQFAMQDITCPRFPIPDHWLRIGGLDVGLNHPTCAVAVAIDPESGVAYVYREYKKAGEQTIYHASHLKEWGIRFAIDPNANQRDKVTGQTPMGVFVDVMGDEKIVKANNRYEVGIPLTRSMFAEERLFIFDDLHELIKELQTYRYKDNVALEGMASIHKFNDDLCLAGDTIVQTVDGPRMIADLIGTEVMVNTPIGSRLAWNIHKKPTKRKVLRIVTECGATIVGTHDHKILVAGKGFMPLRDITERDRLIYGGIHGSGNPYGKETKVQREELLQMREVLQSPDWEEPQGTASSCGMGVSQWTDSPWNPMACPSFGWEYKQQLSFKPGIDLWARTCFASYARAEQESCVEGIYKDCNCSGSGVASKRGGFGVAPGTRERIACGESAHPGSRMPGMRRRVSSKDVQKKGNGFVSEVLQSELQDEGVSSPKDGSHGRCGCCDGHTETMRSVQARLFNKQAESIKTLFTLMHTRGITSIEEIEEEIDVYDLSVDDAQCFLGPGNIVISNCDSLRYSLTRLDAADMPRIGAKKKSIIRNTWKPTDNRLGY